MRANRCGTSSYTSGSSRRPSPRSGHICFSSTHNARLFVQQDAIARCYCAGVFCYARHKPVWSEAQYLITEALAPLHAKQQNQQPLLFAQAPLTARCHYPIGCNSTLGITSSIRLAFPLRTNPSIEQPAGFSAPNCRSRLMRDLNQTCASIFL
jgi:hypothetical protein